MKEIPNFEREHLVLYFVHLYENVPLAHAFVELGSFTSIFLVDTPQTSWSLTSLPDQMVWVARFIHTSIALVATPFITDE
jgi:hypothetical protein